MAADRIRVFIAGNIYVKRALVRRFLEDDGFEVTGEARNREDMVAAVRRDQPDAVVIDDELLTDGPGGGTIGRLRRGAPDAKVVVFTSSPVDPASAPYDADGYLEKGLGLASLTALLGRLFSQPATTGATIADASAAEPTDELEPALAAARNDTIDLGAGGAEALATESAPDDADGGVRELVGAGSATSRRHARPSTRNTSVAAMSRVAAMVAGAVLIVWGLGAMIASGGDDAPTRALDRTDTTDGTVVEPQPTDDETSLDRAYATLDELVGAIENGNYVLATVSAQTLMDLREQARASGFALTGLDAAITARLETLVGDIPVRVSDTLAEILGSLYPRVSPDADEPGGGSDVVLGTTVTDDDDDTAAPPRDTDGSDGDGPGDRPGGDGPDPQPEAPAPQPGDGREWGHSHHPQGGPPGHDKSDRRHGPTPAQRQDHDGGKPPWAGP